MSHSTTNIASFGVWRLTLLVAGNIIGSGIFLLPASLAKYGSISLLAWGFTALGALALALVFAELSAVLGSEGGFYSYCRDAFGDFVGFQVAYSYWIALWIGNAALVVALTGYLSLFWPILQSNVWIAFLVNISIVWLLTALNIFRVQTMVWLQTISTLVKLVPLLLITVLGFLYLKIDHFAGFNLTNMSSLQSFNEAATMTLWSFLGLESASLSSNYLSNPKRDIPRATVWGVALAALLYIGSYVAIIGMMPFSALAQSSAPYADAIQPFLGVKAKQSMALLAVLSCVGSLAGWILLQGQMPLAAARDKLFPAIFLKENKQKVPVTGLVISSSLITVLLMLQLKQSLVSQFAFIIVLATLSSLIPYFFTSMAAIALLLKYKTNFSIRGSLSRTLFLSIAGGLYTFWAIIGAGPVAVFYGCLLLFSSLPVYVGLQWQIQSMQAIKNEQKR